MPRASRAAEIDGVSVRELLAIARSGQLEVDLALHIALQVARAQEDEARAGLHRDIKPATIVIDREGAVRLCDALAPHVPGAEFQIVGSPYYLSPEAIEGRPDLDVRADIYALGATLFHLVTGGPPFAGPTPEAVCLEHLTAVAPDPRARNAGVSPGLAALLLRTLEKDRARRPASWAELAADLAELAPDPDDQGTLTLAGLVEAAAPGPRPRR